MAFPKFTFKNFGEKLQQALLRFHLRLRLFSLLQY